MHLLDGAAGGLGRQFCALARLVVCQRKQRAPNGFTSTGIGRAFVLGRAALRALLASYLGMDAAEVQFTYGPQGKPALAHPEIRCPLRFNASNSGDLAAYAFTTGCEIGVDVEQHRALPISKISLAGSSRPKRRPSCWSFPPAEKTAGFFNCWTRKEAYIKAMGGGLSIPLDSFRVTLRPGAAARMVSLDGSERRCARWTLHDFHPAPDYAGAIAYADQPRSIQTGPVVSLDGLLEVRRSCSNG